MNRLNSVFKWKALLFSLVILFMASSSRGQLIISTIAGDGTPAFSGDGGPATAASVNKPYAVAIGPTGKIYIADYDNNRIRCIDTFGVITTVGGTGIAGFSGDGGPATNARIYAPRSVTTDATGNIFFSDYANNRIRKITTAGIISTVAGNGTPGFGGDGGAATAAMVKFAWGVGVDAAGNIYIADQNNCRIRKVNTAGIISTIGGTGIAFFSGDGGPAISAGIQYPMGLAVDGPGNVYICDEGDSRIRKINTAGIISTVAGISALGFSGDGGPATTAKLYYPQGVALDGAGNIYIADLNNNRIRMVTPSGIINTVIGNGTAAFAGDGGPPIAASINQSTGVAVDATGRIYIADNDNHRIRMTHILSHAPYFIAGNSADVTMCPVESISIDSVLKASDIDAGQTETWSMVVAPAHGTLTSSYTTLSTGTTMTPSGLLYFPGGYTGLDSFKMRITDGTYSDTITIYVTILTLPVAGTIAGIDTLCPGETYTFTDGVPGGTWSSANTTLASVSGIGVVTATAVGNVVIKYTVSNTCGSVFAQYTLHVATSGCHVGISELINKDASGINIYPNPNSGKFAISFGSDRQEEVIVTITNALGQKMTEIKGFPNKQMSIESDLPSGIYYISAITTNGKWGSKLTIVR